VHEQQKDYDALRDEIINLHGIKVMRFTNAEVMSGIGSVLERIVKTQPCPSPRGKGVNSPLPGACPEQRTLPDKRGREGDGG